MRLFVCFVLPLFNIAFFNSYGAGCDTIEFTAPENIEPSSDFLLVTHPSFSWDPRSAAKVGVDFLMARYASQGKSTVILRHVAASGTYYNQNCQPSYYVQSVGGEFSFQFEGRELTVAGGQFHQCFRKTFHDVLEVLARNQREARIKVNGEAIYATFNYIDSHNLPRISDFLRKVGNGPTLAPVYLTLGQMMRLLNQSDQELLVRRFLEDNGVFTTVPEGVSNNFQIAITIDDREPFIVFPGSEKITIHLEVNTGFPSPFLGPTDHGYKTRSLKSHL